MVKGKGEQRTKDSAVVWIYVPSKMLVKLNTHFEMI